MRRLNEADNMEFGKRYANKMGRKIQISVSPPAQALSICTKCYGLGSRIASLFAIRGKLANFVKKYSCSMVIRHPFLNSYLMS